MRGRAITDAPFRELKKSPRRNSERRGEAGNPHNMPVMHDNNQLHRTVN
jgi:hypothetical protein